MASPWQYFIYGDGAICHCHVECIWCDDIWVGSNTGLLLRDDILLYSTARYAAQTLIMASFAVLAIRFDERPWFITSFLIISVEKNKRASDVFAGYDKTSKIIDGCWGDVMADGPLFRLAISMMMVIDVPRELIYLSEHWLEPYAMASRIYDNIAATAYGMRYWVQSMTFSFMGLIWQH